MLTATCIGIVMGIVCVRTGRGPLHLLQAMVIYARACVMFTGVAIRAVWRERYQFRYCVREARRG